MPDDGPMSTEPTSRPAGHIDPGMIDPVLRADLPTIMAAAPRPITMDNLGVRRKLTESTTPTLADLRRPGVAVEQRRVEPDGPVVYVLRPADATGPRPCVLHLHGGGMVIGSARGDLDGPLSWVTALGVVVVSPEYRLAPEHPHPAPVQDCYAALRWVAANAEDLGVDRIVVAGVSAGGGLAAGTALLARDRGGPRLAGQLLVYPMLDDRTVPGPDLPPDPNDPWDRWSNLTGWTALLGATRGGDAVSPYAAPARATGLSGLPPTYLDVGSVDLFRDEDVDYVRRIWAAGGNAELHVWPGAYHGFESRVPHAPVSLAARAARTDWLRRVLR